MDKTKSYYKSKDFIGKFLKKQRVKNVIKFIDGSLLDIACGDNTLVKIYGNGIGIDISDYGADKIVKNYYNLPFENKSFNTVTIVASINYFEEPDKVLKEIKRILKDEGNLIITNTNAFLMKVWHIFRESWAYKSGYTKDEMKRLLEENGFKIKEKYYFNLLLSCLYINKKDINE